MRARARKAKIARRDKYRSYVWICDDTLLAKWGIMNGELYVLAMYDRLFDRPTYYHLGVAAIPYEEMTPSYIGGLVMAIKRVKIEGTSPGAKTSGFDDPGFAKKFPLLYEQLTETTFEGGEARITSSIILFAEEGALKACLSERNDHCSLWATANTLDGVMKALEAALTTGNPQWRKQKPVAGRKK